MSLIGDSLIGGNGTPYRESSTPFSLQNRMINTITSPIVHAARPPLSLNYTHPSPNRSYLNVSESNNELRYSEKSIEKVNEANRLLNESLQSSNKFVESEILQILNLEQENNELRRRLSEVERISRENSSLNLQVVELTSRLRDVENQNITYSQDNKSLAAQLLAAEKEVERLRINFSAAKRQVKGSLDYILRRILMKSFIQ